MLPIEIQMQIDLSAQHHSREIARQFEELRVRLLPEPFAYRLAMYDLQRALRNGDAYWQSALAAQQSVHPCGQYAMGAQNALRFTVEEVNAAEALTGCYFPFGTLDALFGPGWLKPPP